MMRKVNLKYLCSIWMLLYLTYIPPGCISIRSLGKNPSGEALKKLEQLPNYRNGQFQNLDSTDNAVHKVKPARIFKAMFNRPETTTPSAPVPWVKTSLTGPAPAKPTVVWFGHSSVLVRSGKVNILIDPIFSSNAGPVPGMIKAFAGSTHYTADDMPMIDALIISHDHYDHLDYKTVKKLKDRIKKVVVPMGVGSHFIYWGFNPQNVVELNWNESFTLPDGTQITAAPARHRSNRTLAAKKTLWASYIIRTDGYRLFYSGDGGYGSHFKQIGQQYGPFDLALMECGQYSVNWSHHHMFPAQSAQAGADVQAKMIMPVHWGKFAESTHPWNESVKLLLPAAKNLNINVTVPKIGEPYTVGEPAKQQVWWNFK